MKKKYKGMCPPIITLGFLFVVMICSAVLLLTGVAQASNVVPGSEVAPPGGSTVVVTDTPDVTPTEQPVVPQDTLPPVVATVPPETATPTVQPTPEATEPAVTVEPTEEPTKEPDPVGAYPARLDTAGIKLVSPSIEELTAQGANLEALLYPSGLKLPTKYMDLLMCAPTNTTTELSGETVNFLKTVAPVEGNIYTYAEYKAAEVYLAICRLAMADSSMLNSAGSIQSLDKNTSVNWMTNITNATLSDGTRLASLIANYSAILEQVAKGADISQHSQYRDLINDHRGVRYSCGNLAYIVSLADGSTGRDSELATYLLGLYSWWDYIGVTQNLTSAVLTYSEYYNEFAYNNINYNHGAPVVAFEPTESAPPPANSGEVLPGGTEVQGPGDKPGSSGIVQGGSENNPTWMNPSTEGSGDRPVSSVGGTSEADQSIIPAGGRNLKEIASIGAVVFVIIAIIALWAIRAYRKGTDPISRFLK